MEGSDVVEVDGRTIRIMDREEVICPFRNGRNTNGFENVNHSVYGDAQTIVS
jgi:hypothetical protein